MQLPQIAQKEPWRVEVKGEIGDTNSHVMDFAGMQLRYRNTLIDTNDFMTAQKNPDDDDDLHKKQVEKEIYFFNCLHHWIGWANERIDELPWLKWQQFRPRNTGIDQ